MRRDGETKRPLEAATAAAVARALHEQQRETEEQTARAEGGRRDDREHACYMRERGFSRPGLPTGVAHRIPCQAKKHDGEEIPDSRGAEDSESVDDKHPSSSLSMTMVSPTTPSGNSLVERLRSKSQTRAVPSIVIEDTHRVYRGVTRSVKMLWCEWRLAKADQQGEVRRALPSLLGLEASRVISGGLRRRHQSVKDMTLASSSVTQLLTFNDVITQLMDWEGSSVAFEARNFDEHLGVLMVTKVYFPQRLLCEWKRSISDLTSKVSAVAVSTSQLLGLDATPRAVTKHDPDESTTPVPEPTLQLPPMMDVAWRRDDLVHLPSRVLLYEPTTERLTLEVLLMRAREAAAVNPLRLFSVGAWVQCERRLDEQLTATVTSKERFAIEISHHHDFDRVIAMVSSIINQHALLCIPEWYVISSIQVYEQVTSPAVSHLQVHIVRQSVERVSITSQLALWLSQNAALEEADARTTARCLLDQASLQDSSGAPVKPLSAAVEALVSRSKLIAQSGESAGRQRQLRQRLLQELELNGKVKQYDRSVEHRSLGVLQTRASLEFLADLFVLPPQRLLASQGASTVVTADQTSLPSAFPALIPQLEIICDALSRNDDEGVSATSEFNSEPRIWRTLVLRASPNNLARARHRTISHVREFLELVKIASATGSKSNRTNTLTLVRHGYVPVDWLAERFPTLSDACLSNIISVAQVLVLLVSRVGFILHALSGASSLTLNLSLLDDPRVLLREIQNQYASRRKCDPGETVFVLLPGVVPSGMSEPKDGDGAGHAQQRGRRNSQLPRQSDVLCRSNSGMRLDQENQNTCLVYEDDSSVCGIQVEGLVALERVHSQSGTSHVFIHTLPTCRLVCHRRSPHATHQTTMKDSTSRASSSRQLTTENLATARLKQEGVRLTMIASMSPLQSLPDTFWTTSESEDTDPDTVMSRVVFSPSLLLSIPSLSRARPESDNISIVLAIPVFPADDDDQDL